MNIKRINETLESEISIIPQQQGDLNLLELYKMRLSIKCNGKYEDYLYYKDYEFPSDGRYVTYYHEYETRVYYDSNKDVVVSYCNSEDKTIPYYDEYHYDKENDKLVEDRTIYDSSGLSGSEFLSYYKCCKKDLPYFKPIKIEGDLTIDCFLNIHKGEEEIANLHELVNVLIASNEYAETDKLQLYHLLTTLTVKSSDLPKVYREYLEHRKQKNQIRKI